MVRLSTGRPSENKTKRSESPIPNALHRLSAVIYLQAQPPRDARAESGRLSTGCPPSRRRWRQKATERGGKRRRRASGTASRQKSDGACANSRRRAPHTHTHDCLHVMMRERCHVTCDMFMMEIEFLLVILRVSLLRSYPASPAIPNPNANANHILIPLDQELF